MASLWDAIDDELYRLPPELKDPRFDSLRHVLSIVSSVNAESSVAEVSRTVSSEPSALSSSLCIFVDPKDLSTCVEALHMRAGTRCTTYILRGTTLNAAASTAGES